MPLPFTSSAGDWQINLINDELSYVSYKGSYIYLPSGGISIIKKPAAYQIKSSNAADVMIQIDEDEVAVVSKGAVLAAIHGSEPIYDLMKNNFPASIEYNGNPAALPSSNPVSPTNSPARRGGRRTRRKSRRTRK